MTRVVSVPEHYIGPPGVGHGGYVAGLVAGPLGGGADGAVQITLRRPTPPGVDLRLDVGDGGLVRLLDERDVEPALIAEAEPSTLAVEVPTPPALEDARSAQSGSPSYWNDHGVHPICLGCGLARTDDEGLAIPVGPLVVDGTEQVAAVWRPTDRHAAEGGSSEGDADPWWVLAALDCPGAMAYIARDIGVGLLGRIVFEQHAPARVGADHIVTGWQIARDGRKHDAGTALFTSDGELLATSRAIWFGRG